MYVLAVINQKGGVGKTTTAVQLAAGLGMRGYRVLACDMDAQANLTGTLLGDGLLPAGRPTTYEVLVGEAAPEDAIVRASRCDLMPASQAVTDKRLAVIDAAIGNQPNKLYRMREALSRVKGSYDFAVLDTPPARDTLAYNALTAADGIVIPSEAGEYSLDGIADLADSIAQTRRYTNPALKILGLVITRQRADTCLGKGMAKGAAEIAESLSTRVFPRPIRQTVKVGESQAVHTDIFDYAPGSGVAEDYAALIDEVLEEVEHGN